MARAWRQKLSRILTGAAVGVGAAACVWLALEWRDWRRPDAPPERKLRGLPGMWRPIRTQERKSGKASRLQALPYLSGYRPAPDKIGVTVHDPRKAQDGLNLVFSGHGPEAELLDMKGRVMHRWSLRYSVVRRRFPAMLPPSDNNPWAWRRGRLLPDGALLAIFDGFGMIKLDRDSKLLWAFPKRVHHDAFVDREGKITTLTRRPRVVPRVHPTEPVLVDYITVLSPDGRMLSQRAVLESFEGTRFEPMLKRIKGTGDILHTNTIEVLDGRHAGRAAAFAAGNLLISIREIDVLAIIDPRTRKVAWAATGAWRGQHDPLLLDSGTMLLFDNLGAAGKSRVVEFDPLTRKIVWEYRGQPGQPLDSAECGASYRMKNGNTLIVESLAGRALEVAPDGKIVWEYFSPHRAGSGRKVIATLFDVQRIPRESVSGWLRPTAPLKTDRR